LIGGDQYEPKEGNPMLGWRGASRYYHPNYKEGFALECKAVKKIRDEMGLVNLQVMIPFCRTIEEAKKVIKEMESNGLKQHKDDLKIICMCEIPSNILLADQFLDIFDGYSIGSNDLTQLILGVDRNSEVVSSIFDERNEAVKKMIGQVIRVANEKGKYIGICGQAPSDFPEFAVFLMEQGIQSISLNSDTVVKTILQLAEAESNSGKKEQKKEQKKESKKEPKKEQKKEQKKEPKKEPKKEQKPEQKKREYKKKPRSGRQETISTEKDQKTEQSGEREVQAST